MQEQPPLERQEELRQLRRENRLREEKLRSRQLEIREHQEKNRKLREWWQTDWLDPYLSAMTAGRNALAPFGVAGMWQRKNGNNYPLYRTEQELALLRFPSRWLASTNSYAIGFVQGLTSYILGDGMTYRIVPKEKEESLDPLVKHLQTGVDAILDANEWYGGELPGFEEEYFQRTLEDGEAIAIHFPDEATGVCQFRFAEPEQLRHLAADPQFQPTALRLVAATPQDEHDRQDGQTFALGE